MIYTWAKCLKKYGTRYAIKKAIQSGNLYRIERGMYSTMPRADRMEIAAVKYPEAVMTMDTAFYYHGLTDDIPDRCYIATPRSAKALRDTGIKQIYVDKDIFDKGVTEAEKEGIRFRIYDRERMLIELLRYKNSLPYDYYKEILHSYRKIIGELDIERIQDYAATFPKHRMIEDTLEREVF